MRERKLFSITGISNRAFSVTWPVATDGNSIATKVKREFNTQRTGLGQQYTNIAEVNKMPCQ